MTDPQHPTAQVPHPAPDLAGERAKYCKRCGHTHPISDFHRDRTTKDGLYGQCRSCKLGAGTGSLPVRRRRPRPPTAVSVATTSPGRERVCSRCGGRFRVGRSLPNRIVCGPCQDKHKIPADQVVDITLAREVLRRLSPDEARTIQARAVQTLLRRHRQEFQDICVLETDRLLAGGRRIQSA